MTLAVPDGASNGINALKTTGMDYEICDPHQLQRAVLYAVGLAGKESVNPEFAAVLKKQNKIGAKVHMSTKTTKTLHEIQEKRGVKKHQVREVRSEVD